MSAASVSIDAPWRQPGAATQVLSLLDRDGEEARVVGGAVRNLLLSVPIGDIDIATTALPNEVMRRAATAGIKTVPTGIAHGTVTLIVDGVPFEVTTLREDIETFGRKANVAFGRDWVADARRRDFTINALSCGIDGVVHDYTSGLDDIAARRVRFIGDADARIAEDFLRILRFFRIHAAYGSGAPDAAGCLACIRGRSGLASLSAERIRAEMLKLVVASGARQSLATMEDAGLLLAVLGGVVYRGPFAAMVAIESSLGLAADPIRRLAALGIAITEDARRLSERLRLTKGETKALDSIGHRWWRLNAMMDDAVARRRLYRIGASRYRDRLLFAWARSGYGPDTEQWRAHATLPERWTPPDFPLKAADLAARGLARGPKFGQALALAEDAWLASDFTTDRPALDRIADEAVARVTDDARGRV